VSRGVATDKAPSQSGLFTRKSSGLVRELGIPSAIGIALASVVVVNTFLNFYAGLTGFSQADMTLPLLVAAAIWVVAMFAYKNLLEAIPRAGGEYVYVSRVISPVVGAMVGISLAVAFLFFLGSASNFIAQYIPFALTSIGAALKSSSITDAASQITSTSAVAIISVCVLLLLGVCSVFPVRRVAQVVLALVVLQAIAYLSVGFLLLTHSHSDFVAAFGQFSSHPNAYNDILDAASKAKLPLGVSFAASLTVVPFMFLNFNGSLYGYYVGGELKRPGRTYLWASAFTIAFLVVVWLGVWLLMLDRIGLNFMQAQSQLAATDPSAYGAITSVQASANGLGYGLVLSGDPVTKILIGIAIPISAFALLLAFMVVVTRILFALAFDRLLPVALAELSERGVPVRAIVVAVVGGIAFTLLNAYGTLVSISANLSLFSALIVLSGSVAAMLLPFRRPDLALKPGTTDVPRLAGIPTASIWGGASTILVLITIALIVTHPSVFGSFSFASVAALVVILAAGPIIYLIARQIRLSRSSIDLGLAMRELPPE
jgi:basic amino acid/polyamine antiporter, APA family